MRIDRQSIKRSYFCTFGALGRKRKMLSRSSQRSVSEIVDATNAAPVGESRHPNSGSRRSNAAKDAAVAASLRRRS